ncbi:MAG: amidohydrolase family protein [Acidobacteria bacterium]|nr:amidohydrolase family protein [Acidobacteriota bacterium]
MHLCRVLTALLFTGPFLLAQETFPQNGVHDSRANRIAFTHATVWIDAQTKMEDATLLVREGRIESVEKGEKKPAGYQVVDLTGKWVYPSFIDLYTQLGIPEVKQPQGSPFRDRAEQIGPEEKGPFNANDAIKSQFSALNVFAMDEKATESMRKIGFGTVLSFRADGIARGTSVLSLLNNETANLAVIKQAASTQFSLRKGSSSQNFPISPMGAIALLRQTHFDATWYANQNPKPFVDASLDAYLQTQSLPAIFEVPNWQLLISVNGMGKELGKSYIFKTDGDDYQRVDAIKKTGASLIVPLDFPKDLDVTDPFDAEIVSLAELKHWELAPTNPAALARADIRFALTTAGLEKDPSKFTANLKKAIKAGLTEADALAALTSAPADMLGISELVGRLKPQTYANFLVCSGPLFDEKSEVLENWVRGQKYSLKNEPNTIQTGHFLLKVGTDSWFVDVEGQAIKPEFKAQGAEGEEQKINGTFSDGQVFIALPLETGQVRINLWPAEGGFVGTAVDTQGQTQPASLMPTSEKPTPKEKEKAEGTEDEKGKPETEKPAAPAVAKEEPKIGPVTYPLRPFGWTKVPDPEIVLIRKATVWTNETDGVLKETDVLLENGKIAQIGKNLSVPRAKIIEANGRHLTAGIIDEHSHIALFSVNDVATNSGSVRMSDVVDAQDVDIYRNLAGGVVAAQLLHGSANPVGGQSALIKMRWGKTAPELLIENADPFIKFALGENVKRAPMDQSIRYPQTRMGVEQVYRDWFSQAQAYDQKWKAYNALSTKEKARATAPRRDLTLETMAQILRGERFVTCHSYVQSEINMLMKVAEDFGFHINTFTHILEGYKVADKMAAHGVGGAGFSDWWAYKMEVSYAIPYNATLMTEAGVTAAINSDDAEMARRLNQEAAKSVKYGNMSEEDALKLVTLNPAKLLHLDKRMGSIKVGKDADVVLWSDHPLSIYAKADTTWVDGIAYYDRERDQLLQKQVEEERNRLIQKLLSDKKPGGDKKKPNGREKPHFHCDDLGVSEWGY